MIDGAAAPHADSLAARFGGPLLVVGPSRSGTSLMRVVLNGHPDIGLAGETHYFDDLRIKFKARATISVEGDERQRCEDYFLALTHRPYGHGGVAAEGEMQREVLRTRADRLGGSPDAYYEAFCRLTAEHVGARVWGDKTPRHVFRIGEIVGRFPRARIVCMVRDPRAVVLSYRDWQNQGGFDFDADPEHEQLVEADSERARQSYNVLLMSLLWRSQVGAIRSAQQTYGDRVFVQRYEDVVTRPEASIRALCRWAGLEFDQRMLEVPILNSSFNRFSDDGGISTASLDRWRQQLSTEELAVIQTACRSLMLHLDYETVPASKPFAVMREATILPVASVRALKANQGRTGRLPAYLARRLAHLVRRP